MLTGNGRFSMKWHLASTSTRRIALRHSLFAGFRTGSMRGNADHAILQFIKSRFQFFPVERSSPQFFHEHPNLLLRLPNHRYRFISIFHHGFPFQASGTKLTVCRWIPYAGKPGLTRQLWSLRSPRRLRADAWIQTTVLGQHHGGNFNRRSSAWNSGWPRMGSNIQSTLTAIKLGLRECSATASHRSAAAGSPHCAYTAA